MSLAIYDVRGRLVRSLLSETMVEGQHDVVWQGRDERGRSVASGIYFARITAGDLVETRSMALVK